MTQSSPQDDGVKLRPPPEVVVDACGRQVLATTSDGERYRQYLPCSYCGWLIGCGDAIETIAHQSCGEAAKLSIAQAIAVHPAENREDLVERLIAGMATAAAVAVANGKWAHEEHRRAEAAQRVVTELLAVWDGVRGCRHAWDEECARCHWLKPLADALAAVPSPRVETPGQHEEA